MSASRVNEGERAGSRSRSTGSGSSFWRRLGHRVARRRQRREQRRQRSADGRMTIMEHLVELRQRLIKSIVAVAVGTAAGFVFAPWAIRQITQPLKEATGQPKLIAVDVLETFTTRLQVAVWLGGVISAPIIMLQIWRFVTPGLKDRERKYAIPLLLTTIVLFALGCVIAVITLPKALEFLLKIGGTGIEPQIRAKSYVTFVLFMALAFGISFEFPIAIMLLLLSGVLTTAQLRSHRRATFMVILVFAAVITPSQDPFSLFAMAIPMYVLFEVSILVGRILRR